MNGQQSLEFLKGISESNFEKHVWTTFRNQYETIPCTDPTAT